MGKSIKFNLFGRALSWPRNTNFWTKTKSMSLPCPGLFWTI